MQPADKVSPGRFSTQSQYVENSNRTLHQKNSIGGNPAARKAQEFPSLFCLHAQEWQRREASVMSCVFLNLTFAAEQGTFFSTIHVVWTAFEISWLIFAGGRLSQIIMSDRSKAGIEFCTQRELKGADNQVQKYANGIMPFYTENLLMNDIQTFI